MNSGRIATATGNSSPSVNRVYIELAARERAAGEDERRERREQHDDDRRHGRDDARCCASWRQKLGDVEESV